jgi:CTP:molybdopterin cytidylyltransferase MocA
VRVGLGALEGQFDAVLISLADQPLIGAGDLIELIAVVKSLMDGRRFLYEVVKLYANGAD